jgi:hypothetical protein
MIDSPMTLSDNIAGTTSAPAVLPPDAPSPIMKPVGEPSVEVKTAPSVQQPLASPLPLKI